MFVDTNILVYATQITSPHRDAARTALQDHSQGGARRFAAAFEVLEDGPEVGARLAELCRSVALAGRQVHDANIVATMLAHGETRLLTANGGDFQRFAPRIVVVGL
jgi:predicted nucleic acid-binding protein